MELTMNTIIIAVIALIVLVVLVFIFTGRIRTTSTATQDVVETYEGERCGIPGTQRVCRAENDCRSIGGLSNGVLDCAQGICCSK